MRTAIRTRPKNSARQQLYVKIKGEPGGFLRLAAWRVCFDGGGAYCDEDDDDDEADDEFFPENRILDLGLDVLGAFLDVVLVLPVLASVVVVVVAMVVWRLCAAAEYEKDADRCAEVDWRWWWWWWWWYCCCLDLDWRLKRPTATTLRPASRNCCWRWWRARETSVGGGG